MSGYSGDLVALQLAHQVTIHENYSLWNLRHAIAKVMSTCPEALKSRLDTSPEMPTI